MKTTTHFGYQTVAPAEKTEKVGEVFHTVAGRYDVMNDLMSLGLHRLWKRYAVLVAGVRARQKVLDLASGTGDVARHLHKQLQGQGTLVVSDINASMLALGREKLINAGCVKGAEYIQANAEALPFASASFDVVSIAFGLRNMTDKARAMTSMARVLKPGGVLYILEFSKPHKSLARLYDEYSFKVVPALGRLFANSRESYQYLVESIRMHPGQEALQEMLYSAGFDAVSYQNLLGGIVALHKAVKY